MRILDLSILIVTLAAGLLVIPLAQSQPVSQPIPRPSPSVANQQQKSILGQPSPNGSPSLVAPSPARKGEEGRNPDFLVQVKQQSEHDEKSWLRVIWDSLLPWPILIIAIIAYLLFSNGAPNRIESLLRPFQSVKLFGQEFVLNQWGGRNAETAIRFYRQEVQTKFDRKAKKLKIADKHKAVIDQYAAPIISELASNEASSEGELTKKQISKLTEKQVRSTIHIPDMLFDEALYQLLEYYPEHRQSPHGRSFPVRYGIIGKAWRLGKSQYESKVPTSKERLIFEWGMTKGEAEQAGKGRQSFACIVLENKEKALGIFYLDAPAEAAFGDNADAEKWKKLENAIRTGAEATKLIDALEAIHKDLLDSSPRVQIFDKAGKSS